MRRPCLIFIGLVLAIALGWSASAEAATYWVSATGGTTQASCAAYTTGSTDPGFYLRTVQAGINCVTTTGPHTVMVKAGTYTENVTINSKTNLTLDGMGVANLRSTNGTNTINMQSGNNVTIQKMNIGPCGSVPGPSLGICIEVGFGGGSGTGYKFYDNYIHGEHESSNTNQGGSGIKLTNGSNNVDIQGNVFAFNEHSVYVNCTPTPCAGVTMHGNYSLNPMGKSVGPVFGGNHFGAYKGNVTLPWNSNITVTNNYMATIPGQTFNGKTEDSINLAFTDGALVQNNWIRGGSTAQHTTGCHLLNEHQALNIQWRNNISYQAGTCGMNIAAGQTLTIDGNLIQNDFCYTDFSGAVVNATQGIKTQWFIDGGTPEGGCNNLTFSNNIVASRQCPGGGYVNDGKNSNFTQNPTVCTNVTLTANDFTGTGGWTALDPILTTHPPPLIPPVPKTCVAVSPFSTQTGTSCSAAADSTPPSVPTGLGLTVVSATRIDLAWTASTDDTAVTGYDIWRCSGAACTPIFVTTPAGTATTFQNTGLTGGTLYRYQVAARDAAGNVSALSTPIQEATTTAADVTPPASTTGLTVTPTSASRLSLDWAANGEGDLAGYRIYECNGTAVPGCTPTGPPRADVPLLSDFIARGLLGNTLYRYRVTAYDNSNNESALGSATIVENTTQTIPAGSPEILLSFEVGAGTTVYDDSGHGHNSSTYTGTFSATAHDGSWSGSFSGTQIGRIPRISGAGPTGFEPSPTNVTIAVWVRRAGAPTSNAILFRKAFQNEQAAPFLSYGLNLNPNALGVDTARCEVGLVGGAVSQAVSASGPGPITDGGWVHLACVYEPGGAFPQHRLYVNGALNGPTPAAVTTAIAYDQTATGDLYLSDNGNSQLRYTGLMDEVQMYPRVLTLAEIQGLAGVGDSTPPAAPQNLRVVNP